MAEDETFKITDRRGRAKDAVPPEPAGSTPAVEPARGDAPPPARGVEPPGPGPGHGPMPRPDLQGLFVMFASSALINLGDAPDPASGQHHVDLDGAREAIDVLLLLRDKTAGNRTEQESRFLEQVLYDLQMRFVGAARAAPPT
jgi:hypothetical protein